eukprot:5644455-Prymnesium_polylepis.1
MSFDSTAMWASRRTAHVQIHLRLRVVAKGPVLCTAAGPHLEPTHGAQHPYDGEAACDNRSIKPNIYLISSDYPRSEVWYQSAVPSRDQTASQ